MRERERTLISSLDGVGPVAIVQLLVEPLVQIVQFGRHSFVFFFLFQRNPSISKENKKRPNAEELTCGGQSVESESAQGAGPTFDRQTEHGGRKRFAVFPARLDRNIVFCYIFFCV